MNRREFLKTAGATGLAVIGGRILGAEQVRSGKVTGDGKPLKDVIVTDGLVCVKTDAAGRWSLPFREEARFVSVTIPSGWRTSGAHYLPLAGSASSLDFNLVPWAASAKAGCAFVQVADSEIHSTNEAECRWIGSVREVAAESKAAFVIHTGDICAKNGLEAHIKVMNAETVGVPVFYCIGNHDLVSGYDYGEKLFESIYGPCWHSFDAGGVHFIVTPMINGDAKPSYTHDRVADWMRNDLALVKPGTPVVVFNHNLTLPWDAKRCGRWIGGGEHALDIGSACSLAAFVYGHVHNSYFTRRDGVAFVSTSNPNFGGIDHSPAALRVVGVSAKGKVRSRLCHYPHRRWQSSRDGAVWETKLPGPVLFSGPLAADGKVFVATADDGEGAGTVNALDGATGRILWSRPMGNAVNGRMALAGGRLMALDVDGNLVAFDPKSGKELWRTKLPGFTPEPYKEGIVADETADVVYAGRGGKWLGAFDLKTGEKRWFGTVWKRDSEPCATVPAVGNGVLVDSAQWSGLHGMDAATGKEIWFRPGKTFFHLGARPLVVGAKCYALGGKSFYELDLKTGETIRERELPDSAETATGILMTENRFVFGTMRQGLLALDRQTLEIAWQGAVDPALVVNAPYGRYGSKCVSSEPIRVGDDAVVAVPDGTIRFFDLEKGTEKRKMSTGAPYFASPALFGKNLIAADLSGRIRSWKCEVIK